MPVTGAGTERLGQHAVGAVNEAEAAILAALAIRIACLGDDSDQWAWMVNMALAQAEGRAHAARTLDAAYQRVYVELCKAFTAATELGWQRADADLTAFTKTTGHVFPDAPTPRLDEYAIRAMARELTDHIAAGTRPNALRAVDDVYQQAQATAIEPALEGRITRRQASLNMALDLAEQGLDGFQDAAGRMWSLDTYTEMAVRGAMARTTIAAHLDRFRDRGIRLVQVTYVAFCCDLCADWQGAILADDEDKDIADPQGYKTVSEAMAAGLLHPGCRHTLTFYMDGVTEKAKPIMDADQNAEGYRLTQGQRYRERVVRAKGRRAYAAQSVYEQVGGAEAAAAYAEAKTALAASRGRLTDYVTSNDLTRKRHRESPFGAR